MIIVSDTSVITYLIQIEQLSLLKNLFDKVILSKKVEEELSKVEGQLTLIKSIEWIKIEQISNQELYNEIEQKLDAGEAESIVLAIELNADILLIDEKKGRKIAEKFGLRITGLLGVLIEAKKQNLIPILKPLLDKLIYEIGFRISPKLYQDILKRVGE
ncbi:MAG: DUF3368 domain-containing protein [Flexibacter sp. CG_4_10_14_3_um_filter_32_15]|nr:MAG: DUF3368 domain-containing protein [Flexibacter sp. CG_4_10_14_3_um_filter_32_15]